MPETFCPRCGRPLAVAGDFTVHWFYECNTLGCPDYIEVGDTRNVFPLLALEQGVKKQLLAATVELLQLASSRIKRIDYKTVSITAFEHTLLGCYREQNDYTIAWNGHG